MLFLYQPIPWGLNCTPKSRNMAIFRECFLFIRKKRQIFQVITQVNSKFHTKRKALHYLKLCYEPLSSLIFPSGQFHQSHSTVIRRTIPVVFAFWGQFYCNSSADRAKRSKYKLSQLVHAYPLALFLSLQCQHFMQATSSWPYYKAAHCTEESRVNGEERWQLLVS